jgi:hypothetical protein
LRPVTPGSPVRHDPLAHAGAAGFSRVERGMRRLPLAVIPAAILTLAACSSASPAASVPAPSSAPAAPAAAPTAPALGPLTLGKFPSTADGRAAKGLCQAWANLRALYASNVDNDSPVQLNQWFSGPDWAQARSAAAKLGNSVDWASLAAAYGVATVGDTASLATARNVDKACAAGPQGA